MLLDIYEMMGLDVLAQVDLEKRIHRNQETKALGRMSFSILKTFIHRLEKLGFLNINKDMLNEMIQYHVHDNNYVSDIFQIQGIERPPMITIPEYRDRFSIE